MASCTGRCRDDVAISHDAHIRAVAVCARVKWEDAAAVGLTGMAIGTGIWLEMDWATLARAKRTPLYETEHPND